MAKDEGAQQDYLQLCLLRPDIAFDSLFFTYDPRQPIGKRNWPFILRPKQQEALSKLNNCIKIGRDAVINKSREEGATELVIKFFTLQAMLIPDCAFLIGSRNQDLVDCTGDPTTLYAKIDYTIKYLPDWLLKKLHIERSLLHFKIKDTNSSIDGETTNESFGAGKRATAIFLDEFGRVEPPLANSIKASVSDISRCVIYGSTHWYGTHHAFNQILMRPDIEKITLAWYDNPTKNPGLYTSPKPGVIELKDTDYYFNKWPDIFNKIGTTFNIQDFETLRTEEFPKFVADGCERIPGNLRSVWHDFEEARRSDYRDLSQNIWMSPQGAANQYFDPVVNTQIRSQFLRNPKHEGDIEFKYKGKLPQIGMFKEAFKKRLKWWGDLRTDKGYLRPLQDHNYVIGCDISFGTGASNSTAMIADVNTGELIGEYVTSEHSPEEFADVVTALAKWTGGTSKEAYIIWERNGGHGINFGRRLVENGLILLYTKTTETLKTRVRRRVYGWDNTVESKDDLLMSLRIALKEGLKTKPEKKFIRVYSEDVLNELDSYIITETGQIIAAEEVDSKSGARSRHGDRIIGLGLCILGFLDQAKAKAFPTGKTPHGSLAYRMKQRKQEDAKKKIDWQEPVKKDWK